jgi:hypothetical protein
MAVNVRRNVFGLYFIDGDKNKCLVLCLESHTESDDRSGKFVREEAFIWPISEFLTDGKTGHRQELDEVSILHGADEPSPYIYLDHEWKFQGRCIWFLHPAHPDALPDPAPCRTTIPEDQLQEFLLLLQKDNKRSRPVEYVYLEAKTPLIDTTVVTLPPSSPLMPSSTCQ